MSPNGGSPGRDTYDYDISVAPEVYQMVLTVVAVLGAEGGKALLGDLIFNVKDRTVQRLFH